MQAIPRITARNQPNRAFVLPGPSKEYRHTYKILSKRQFRAKELEHMPVGGLCSTVWRVNHRGCVTPVSRWRCVCQSPARHRRSRSSHRRGRVPGFLLNFMRCSLGWFGATARTKTCMRCEFYLAAQPRRCSSANLLMGTRSGSCGAWPSFARRQGGRVMARWEPRC